MERELFAVTTFCTLHNIDHEFVISLSNEGLIDIEMKDDSEFILGEQLPELEAYTRWHHELGINPQGIDAIRHLVERLRHVQAELNSLKTRLKIYEEEL